MTTYRIGDARPDLKFTVIGDDGDALNLAGSTATTKIRKIPDAGETVSSNQVERPAVPIDLPSARYDHYPETDDFAAGDEGKYKAWLDIILSDGDPLQTDKFFYDVVAPED